MDKTGKFFKHAILKIGGLRVLSLLIILAFSYVNGAEAFTVHNPSPDFHPPQIILQYDSSAGTGADWEKVKNPTWRESSPEAILGRAAIYLKEGLTRMTGREFSVKSTNDLLLGIVLTLLHNASPDISGDPAVRKALNPEPGDRYPQYSASEAFFIRSEKDRLLVVANTPDGLLSAVVELLESAGYEVLGMGPNWTHVPDYRNKTLAFEIEKSGRPSFYIRGLWATSGQERGVGTIMSGLTDPADEPVYTSHWRWVVGTRMAGKSMPSFPGHAMQRYHKQVIEHVAKTGIAEGFLAPGTGVGPVANRPAASEDNKEHLWIGTDTNRPKDDSGFYRSDGTKWITQTVYHSCLDLSVPFVRQILLEEMIRKAQASFEKSPDEQVIFGIDPEDGGGYSVLGKYLKYKNWYPEYLKKEGLPFGRPYVLHGYKGLNQPNEIWDPSAASDTVFGTACWLLHEFDKWVDSLPEEERITTTGKKKKELIRCSFLSYNYHDVPPNFNVDPRIRVMIAGYPKNRGYGKWKRFASHEDVADAFKIMLPKEPSADYQIISLSYYHDPGPEGIPPKWSMQSEAIAEKYKHLYDTGVRAVSIETDFNFGKYGLGYYLISKILWDAGMTTEELDAIRDRWFQRAFGSGWKEMKEYYDFMTPENYPVNAPRAWAKAIRMIDAADKKIDNEKEQDAQRRIDDVKQYWYYHYLTDSGLYDKVSPEVKEYLWKGQMSYMVAMHMVSKRLFNNHRIVNIVPEETRKGPAHYTNEETQQWWAKMLDFWKVTPVTFFTETSLVNGKPAKTIDLNDVVAVKEFSSGTADTFFYSNFGTSSPQKLSFLQTSTRDNETIGFKLCWPYKPKSGRQYDVITVRYGVDIWNPESREWEKWIDPAETGQKSSEITDKDGKPFQEVEIKLEAPRPGTYRFGFERAGNLCRLSSLGYNNVSNKSDYATGFTFNCNVSALTQSPSYFYIPKGTKSVDIEIWDTHGGKILTLYKGLPSSNPQVSRKINVSKMGTHTVALEPGEDGTVAMLSSNGFAFPYMYSIPTLWAKSPAALMVPRAIAHADGLTILE